MEHLLLSKLDKIQADILELKLLKKDVLSFKEACEYLQLSSSTLYKLTSKNQVPHFCPTGKKLYFKRAELEHWLLRNRKTEISQNDVERFAADYLIRNPKKRGGIA